MKEPTREELIDAVNRGDHSLCKDSHDLLDSCPVELGIAILKQRQEREVQEEGLIS